MSAKRCGASRSGTLTLAFLRYRCQALADIKDNEEKDSAFRGICAAIQNNPNGISSSFGYFLNAIARWNRPSPELNEMFKTVSFSRARIRSCALTELCISSHRSWSPSKTCQRHQHGTHSSPICRRPSFLDSRSGTVFDFAFQLAFLSGVSFCPLVFAAVAYRTIAPYPFPSSFCVRARRKRSRSPSSVDISLPSIVHADSIQIDSPLTLASISLIESMQQQPPSFVTSTSFTRADSYLIARHNLAYLHQTQSKRKNLVVVFGERADREPICFFVGFAPAHSTAPSNPQMYAAGPVYQTLAALPLPSLPTTVAKWVPGESPFSTHKEVVTALAVYLVIIFGGQWLMADRKPFREFFSSAKVTLCRTSWAKPRGSSTRRNATPTRQRHEALESADGTSPLYGMFARLTLCTVCL